MKDLFLKYVPPIKWDLSYHENVRQSLNEERKSVDVVHMSVLPVVRKL